MFLDLRQEGIPPEPWQPPRRRRSLSHREKQAVAGIAGFNLLLLLLAPVGGVGLVEALAYLLHPLLR
ncbi:MAG TPA: hypothetical protein VFF98_11745 [Novosphingobium sp.]|nr:hypothetical protein [Novosphingobium sp.]HZV10534.1 hypothetical protein [Novosphingobium sp.]